MNHDTINLKISERCNTAKQNGLGFGFLEYSKDLNLIHEAEKKILGSNSILWLDYEFFLREKVNLPYTIGATSPERAEALFKVIETIEAWQYYEKEDIPF